MAAARLLLLLLSLSCLFEHPKCVKRNPFTGPIALLNRPGTRDRTAQPPSLTVLFFEYQVEQRDKPRVAGITMSGKRLQRTEQVPSPGNTESKPAFVFAFEIILGIQEPISHFYHHLFGLR